MIVALEHPADVDDDTDVVVDDEHDDLPNIGRAPTKPLRPMAMRVEIELEHGVGAHQLAALFETLARLLRDRGRVIVSVE